MKQMIKLLLALFLVLTLGGCKKDDEIITDSGQQHLEVKINDIVLEEDYSVTFKINRLDKDDRDAVVMVKIEDFEEEITLNPHSVTTYYSPVLSNGNHVISIYDISKSILLDQMEVNLTKYEFDSFVQEHIKVTDSQVDIMNKIIEYAKTFPYDYNINNCNDMLKEGKGECWANTDFVIKLASQAGIKASVNTRSNTLKYPDFHINVIALLDGQSYLIDCGHQDRTRVEFQLTEGYHYTINDDATITITDYDSYCDELIIPETIDGHVVSKIANNAFQYHFELESLELPESLIEIGNEAFKDCVNLKQITYSGEHLQIASDAFLMDEPVYLGNTPLTMVSYDFDAHAINQFINTYRS